jgi:hypothetical protein
MDPTKSLLRSIKDTISRNNDLLDGWNAERGIRTERMDMKDELATLRAENEQLRREQDAIRNETLEEAATIAENMPIQIYRDKGIGPAGRSCKPSTFDDAAEAIRILKESSASAALGNGGGDA